MKHKTLGELCYEKAARPVPFCFFTKKEKNETKKQKPDCYKTEGVLIKKKQNKTKQAKKISLVMEDNDYSTQKKGKAFFFVSGRH